jgi:hypothetical protein
MRNLQNIKANYYPEVLRAAANPEFGFEHLKKALGFDSKEAKEELDLNEEQRAEIICSWIAAGREKKELSALSRLLGGQNLFYLVRAHMAEYNSENQKWQIKAGKVVEDFERISDLMMLDELSILSSSAASLIADFGYAHEPLSLRIKEGKKLEDLLRVLPLIKDGMTRSQLSAEWFFEMGKTFNNLQFKKDREFADLLKVLSLPVFDGDEKGYGVGPLRIEKSHLAAYALGDLRRGNDLDLWKAKEEITAEDLKLLLPLTRESSPQRGQSVRSQLATSWLLSHQDQQLPQDNFLETVSKIDFGYRCPELTRLTENLPTSLKEINLGGCDNLEVTAELLARFSDLEAQGCLVQYPRNFSLSVQSQLLEDKLDEAIRQYQDSNLGKMKHSHTKTLLHRFLTESINQRAQNDKVAIKEVVAAARPVVDFLAENPNQLEWVEEISAVFANDGCVNQPVAGLNEISSWADVFLQEGFFKKIEAVKQVLVLNKIREIVVRDSPGQSVEAEGGNALMRDVHQKLLQEKIIKAPWQGIPKNVAYERFLNGWLTPERVNCAFEAAREIVAKNPQEIIDNYLFPTSHGLTFARIVFGGEMQQIQDDYEKKSANLELIIEAKNSGNEIEKILERFEGTSVEKENLRQMFAKYQDRTVEDVINEECAQTPKIENVMALKMKELSEESLKNEIREMRVKKFSRLDGKENTITGASAAL